MSASATTNNDLTDEEFRIKLEKHFSLYRLNLRFPIASRIAPNHWYRVDLLLVNEIGLFRRADIEADGQVILACDLYTPSSTETSITPFSMESDDSDYTFEIRPSFRFEQGALSSERLPIPGFYQSGKGTFEYRFIPKTSHPSGGKRFLHIRPQKLVNFPKRQLVQPENELESVLPLVVGPIEIVPGLLDIHTDSTTCSTKETSLPLELWNVAPDVDMVYDVYRVFSTSAKPPVNIAIHEMWDSGIPGKIWDSALVMLDVMKRMTKFHPDYINQKHMLDLSAGTGLLGLYIASMMASPESTIKQGKITITELDEAVDLIDKNLTVNSFLTTHNPQCELRTKSLLWGNSQEAEACGKADLIIASDVLYEAQFFKDLVKAFVDLSTEKTRIYIGYKRRGFDEAEEQQFWSLCSEHFEVKLLKYRGDADQDDDLVPPMTLETSVQLYRLLPSKKELKH